MVWSDQANKLSERLQVMADKIESGQSCADVGTDHGMLALYLYGQGISPKVILTDISEASLSKAKAAAGAAQFGRDVSFRVGDGLEVIEPGEVDCVVIAGMGGHLIRDILAVEPEKTRSFKKFVLQPRTAAGTLRKWLLEADFDFLSEDIVREGDFLPEIITVAPGGENRASRSDFDYFDDIPGADIAAGIRGTLVRQADPYAEEGILDEVDLRDYPGEDSIHFSVPVWMLNAKGPVAEFLDRKIGLHEDILEGLKKARNPDRDAIARAEADIEYLQQLRELKVHRDRIAAERQTVTGEE